MQLPISESNEEAVGNMVASRCVATLEKFEQADAMAEQLAKDGKAKPGTYLHTTRVKDRSQELQHAKRPISRAEGIIEGREWLMRLLCLWGGAERLAMMASIRAGERIALEAAKVRQH
jgi:hypothetical protein